ncbi:MAG: GGDEF domain-containing protein [Acidobacteriota bacterium]
MAAKPAWKRLLERAWHAPDPDLVYAGQRGEWMLAGLRLLIILFIIYAPLRRFIDSGFREGQFVLWVAVAALAEALVIYTAVRRSWGRGWIGFFSGILDVSLVTLALFISVRSGQPLEAITDSAIFPIYLLAISATSLRYDYRVSILTGAAALLQYGGLLTYVAWLIGLFDDYVDSALVAGFSWESQIARLAILVMATFLAASLVVRAHEQRSRSNRDRLTNLANRGFFDESMARIGALASRTGDPVAVAMIDVDHFKRFNDTYGHLAGDVALREVASMLGESFRTTDLVARYGGEEFAGLFPGMDLVDAARRLDHVRQRIATRPIPIDAQRSVQVTVSIGVAVWPNDGVNLGEVLSLADLRLYRAKTGGRNRVVAVADGGGPDDIAPGNSALPPEASGTIEAPDLRSSDAPPSGPSAP